jgi:hypothetical protein
MRRFIITNLLAFVVLPLLACAGGGSYNYYLYMLCSNDDFSNRMQKICNDNWKVYLGMTQEDWFYFDADKIVATAQSKNDPLMMSYVRQLARYLDCAEQVSREQWDYPTKQQLAQRKVSLEAVRTYAATKLKTRLRSQHALLYMRANMLLKRHAENVAFWEKTASQYIETVYKDMMKNIYAGALYKTGRTEEAIEIFADQGDYRSLMTLFYQKRSYAAIRQEYLKNPNTLVLPFLMQDFVNNAQEAYDAKYDMGGLAGKLFIRDITEAEAKQMMSFCQQVVKEQRTEVPVMWQTAKAWLEYMFGNKQQSLADIRQAVGMQGTEPMADCARAIRIYIETALAKPHSADFDNWIGPEMQWLHDNWKQNEHYSYYHSCAYTRIVQQVLAKHYENEGRQDIAAAIYKSGDYSDYDTMIDTTSIDNLMRITSYLEAAPKTGLDKYLQDTNRKQNVLGNDFRLQDLLGTKYLRLCQWGEAIEWLSKVPASFYNSKGYAPYAALRKTNVEPWLKRQWISENVVYGDRQWNMKENPKLAFAREMQQLEGELNVLKGKARQQRCYDLAVRYAQVNETGDCWFILHDGKSPDNYRKPSDSVPHETNLYVRIMDLLNEAAKTTDPQLKERALFALAYGELQHDNLWYSLGEWNSALSSYEVLPNQHASQWKAFARLSEFEKNNANGPSSYVTLCDEYVQFCKHF